MMQGTLITAAPFRAAEISVSIVTGYGCRTTKNSMRYWYFVGAIDSPCCALRARALIQDYSFNLLERQIFSGVIVIEVSRTRLYDIIAV